MNRDAPTPEGGIYFDIVSSGYIRSRPEKRSYRDSVLSEGQAAPSPSSSSSRYDTANLNIAPSSAVPANNFSDSNAHRAHQSNGLQNRIPVSQSSGDGTRDEVQNHPGKQEGQYEQLLAREKALGERRLQQVVTALSKQRDEADQQLQRVTSLYQQTQSENRVLREDAEKYKVEIRGFIAERRKMEKKSGALRQENAELSEKLKKNGARIARLSQEWSTGRALRLKLHGENQQLLQELKDIEEKARTELRQEFEADLAKVLAKAQLLPPAKQSGPENPQPALPLKSQVRPSTNFKASKNQGAKMP